ncbi:MAG: hypothetical protein LBG13_00080, partial [Holosporales bacterium]|nr:hypothetical protein [Holosporales bacterium]
MLVNGFKITFMICLTVVTMSVLFISYTEHINKYSVFTTQDNSIYIFDKKEVVLTRCKDDVCNLVDTKLPISSTLPERVVAKSARLFGDELPSMVNQINGSISSSINPSPAETKPVTARETGNAATSQKDSQKETGNAATSQKESKKESPKE